ncbi:uncharacterized protein LOC131678362 [Topomyia yanbarensis]|uniref:uncharacterized protein LOC131678362 n=1 Tax=Topomyia yanbarensis TaxID=2498891 RepID=UPI00273AD1D2|nr:uncharacterized protein LOC131678362 [Topomyia yanbarensis]
MNAMIKELKFLCPGPNTKLRAEELWSITIDERNEMRRKGSFDCYLLDYPVSTAFNGSMISMEFRAMYPNAPDFDERLSSLQSKILTRYHDLLGHIKNDFMRTLCIIRQKSPSRGAKRARDADPTKENALKGVIEWIKPEDPFLSKHDSPILYIKGNFLEVGSSAAIIWKQSTIMLNPDMEHCFRILCESFVVFNAVCQPTDKQFYTFVSYVLLGIGHLTTTGERLMQSIE